MPLHRRIRFPNRRRDYRPRFDDDQLAGTVMVVLPDGTVLQIVCQARGATLSEAGYTSAIWDKTIQGD
jgi:hypothetical protein